MKLRSSFAVTAFCTAMVCSAQNVNAQSTWNLGGNNNASTASKLGTKSLIPLRLTTNNIPRIFIDAFTGNVGVGNNAPSLGGLVVDTKVGNTQAVFGSNTSGISLVSSFPSIGFNTYFNNGWRNIASGFAGTMDVNPSTGTISFNNTSTTSSPTNLTPLINRMVIAGNGFVGIGTVNPFARLDLGDPLDDEALFFSKSGFNTAVDFEKTNTSSVTPTVNVVNDGRGEAIDAFSTSGNGIVASTSNASAFAGFFGGNVFTTGVYQSSDEKLKQNIRDFHSAMTIVDELHPKLYQFKNDGNYSLMNLPKGDHYGLIAEDVEKVLPNLVKDTKFNTRTAKPQTHSKENSPSEVVDFKSLNYVELIPILIKAMQEQNAKIESLTEQLNKIQSTSGTSQSAVATNVSSASMEQNIPNPLTNSTSIRYNIPVGATKAQLVITGNDGSTIKQISLKVGGSSTVNIDTSTLSAGTYSYTLIVDGKQIDTKKMVVVK